MTAPGERVPAPRPAAPSARTMVAITGALSRRPDLWWIAVVTLRRLAPPGWWRRRPRLPLPPPGWWAFRMETAYGRTDAEPDVGDVVTYLEWCRSGPGRSTSSHDGPGAPGRHTARGPASAPAGRAKFPG